MTKELQQSKSTTKATKTSKLVLFNDDFNTFEHVINCLVAVCDHTEQQAEQCAILVHYRGRCIVKEGEEKDLMGKCLQLLDEGLAAEVE